MNFNRETYLAKIKPGHMTNDTGVAYTVALAESIYDVAYLHYLTPEENQGNHGIYVDVLGADR